MRYVPDDALTLDDRLLLHRAASVLARSDPDRAQERNDVGFSAGDGPFGHALANSDPQSWDSDIADAAAKMLNVYRRQLEAAGFDTERIARLSSATSHEHLDERQAREHQLRLRYARQDLVDVERRRREVSQRSATIVEGKYGKEIVVSFPYDPILVSGLKDAVEWRLRHFDSSTKTWHVEHAGALLLRTYLDTHSFTYDAVAFDALQAELPPPAPEPEQVAITFSAGIVRVRFSSYDVANQPGHLSALRERFRPSWDGSAWALTLGDVLAAQQSFTDLASAWGVVLPADLLEALAAATEAQRRAAERAAALVRLSLSVESPGITVEGLDGLMAHQLVLPAYARECGWRLLCGDPMGAGKTFAALATLVHKGNVFGNGRFALVVAPANATATWEAEIGERFDHIGITSYVVTSKTAVPFGVADVVIISYSLLGSVTGRPAKPEPGSWVEYFTAAQTPSAVIFDESHYVMHRGSSRSKASRLIARAVAQQDTEAPLLALTGTASPNGRPHELSTQLELIGKLESLGGAKAVKARFASGDLAELIELNHDLRSTCFIRRPKRGPGGILPELELPRRSWEHMETDEAVMALYEEARKDIVAHLRRLRGAEAAGKAARAEVLVKLNRLLELVALAKLDSSAARIRAHLQETNNAKTIVFASHKAVISRLADEFDAVVIDGATPRAMRLEIARSFQDPAGPSVIVCSIMAAAVALTLTAAHDVFFVEQAWRPGDLAQAEARAYGRVNDPHSINATYLVAPETVDEWLGQLLMQKARTITALEDGVDPTTAEEVSSTSLVSAIEDALVASGEGSSDPLGEHLRLAEAQALAAEDAAHQMALLEASIHEAHGGPGLSAPS